jgi:hypothetical protein
MPRESRFSQITAKWFKIRRSPGNEKLFKIRRSDDVEAKLFKIRRSDGDTKR